VLDEQFFTVREVAELLKVSPDTIRRKFKDYPGVVDLGFPETRYGRPYRVLRIPQSVLQPAAVPC
jgi:DNA-binding transcriptional regulator YhcF (GntR family)